MGSLETIGWLLSLFWGDPGTLDDRAHATMAGHEDCMEVMGEEVWHEAGRSFKVC